MADLHSGKGKFWGVDENVNYAVSFTGATKVAEKVKKGGTETKSDGYVVDAIDIDWGGLKLTTIDNGWSQKTISSTEQNAGKGDNTQGIHSTAYLLNLISSSFDQIYNQIGGSDNAGLRKKIKEVETAIEQITNSTPEQLDGIRNRIQKIEQELDNPGAASTMVSILDTLDGFNKNTKGDVKKYIDDHDKAILGTATDSATTYSVYGVRKYVDTTAKTNLIGTSADAATADTIWGAKNYANTTVKNSLLGASGDQWPNQQTLYGVKDYADGVRTASYGQAKIEADRVLGKPIDAATDYTVYGVRKYVEKKTETSYINAVNKANEYTNQAIGTAESTLIGTSTDAATADTIWGAKNYANTTVKNSLLGASGDAWPTKHTIYGVAKYVDTTAKENLIGKDGDTWPNKQTLYGVVKYSDNKNTDLKKILIGASTDAATADTIWGAKNYAVEKDGKLEEKLIGTSTDTTIKTHWGVKNSLIGTASDHEDSNTIWGAKNYAKNQISVTKYNQLTAQVIEENGEGILKFLTVSSYLG